MAIRVTCKCGKQLNLKDELAGRAIKCPGCQQAMRVPGGSAPQQPAMQQPQPSPAGGLDDLFEKEGFKQLTGPVCPACAKEMRPGTFICMECGFNAQTGERLQGHSAAQEASSAHGNKQLDEAADFIRRDAEVQKAVASPGMPWWMLATVFMCIIGLGVVGVFVSNAVVAEEGAAKSNVPMMVLQGICGALALFWLYFHVLIIIRAVKDEEKPTMGLLCIFLPVFPLVYGFMRYKELKRVFVPWLTLILLSVGIYFMFIQIYRLLGVI